MHRKMFYMSHSLKKKESINQKALSNPILRLYSLHSTIYKYTVWLE